jgi:MFS family permease
MCQRAESLTTIPSIALNVIPGWFDKKRGIAYGIAASGSSIGGIIFPIMVQKLIVQVGYGWSMRIAAFMILGLLTISNLTIKSRFPPQPRSMTKEELIQPFREFKMVMAIAGFLLLTFGIFIPIDYVVAEALGSGMDPNIAQYLLAMLNAGRYVFGLFIVVQNLETKADLLLVSLGD